MTDTNTLGVEVAGSFHPATIVGVAFYLVKINFRLFAQEYVLVSVEGKSIKSFLK